MPKVKLIRNACNLDCYWNKQIAISFARNQWVIIFDSDNVMDVDYLDRIYEYEWRRDMILQPSFAKPEFNFSAFEGKIFSKENIAGYIDKHMITTMCNAMNYFVNRDEYLRVWKDDINPHTADSIYQAYNWFAAGNKMLVVPNLSYFHRVHNGSHYQTNRHKTGNRYYEVEQKLRQLK
jgi:glycosyltransferase involved in cell wall biosynthesis